MRRSSRSSTPALFTQLAGAEETIQVPGVGDKPPSRSSRQALAEVVEPRYDELFQLVQAELRRSGFEDLLAAGIVLTGGSSKIEGVVELAEEIFHKPVSLGMPPKRRGPRGHRSEPHLRHRRGALALRPGTGAPPPRAGGGAAGNEGQLYGPNPGMASAKLLSACAHFLKERLWRTSNV